MTNHNFAIIFVTLVIFAIPSFAQEHTDTTVKAKNLDELVVKATNVIRRGNMESYVITKDMREGKRTAGELLNKVNGMHYMPFTEDLTYLGSKNIIMLVDSLERDVSYIKRQSPKRFDRIDIIPQPGGKYNGYDVLINFHSKPNYTGFESNIRGTVDIIPNDQNGKGDALKKTYAYLDMTYMYDKLNISATANWNRTRNNSSTYTSSEYPLNKYSEISIEHDKKDPILRRKRNSLNFQLAGDYKINGSHRISFLWDIEPSSSKLKQDESMKITENGVALPNLVNSKMDSELRSMIGNKLGLYYFGMLGNWNLDISVTYNFSKWNTYYNLQRSDHYNLLYDRKSNMNYFWGGAAIYRWLKNYKWYLGISDYVSVTHNIERESDTQATVSESDILYNNLYATIQYIPSRKLTFVADGGLTLYTNKSGNIHTKTVSPKVRAIAIWNPNDILSSRLSYDISTSMPSLSNISEDGKFMDKYNYKAGNPDLKAATFHYARFSMTFCNRLTFVADYMFSNSKIFNIHNAAFMKNDDGTETPYSRSQYQNGKYGEFGLLLQYQQHFAKYFRIDIWGKATRMNASYLGYKNIRWKPFGSFNLWYSLDKIDLAGAFSYDVSSSTDVNPQGYTTQITDNFCLGVQKGFFNGKLYGAISWYLPIHIAKGNYKSTLFSPNYIYKGWGNNQFRENNMVEVTVLYRFSTGKQVKKVKLNTYDIGI